MTRRTDLYQNMDFGRLHVELARTVTLTQERPGEEARCNGERIEESELNCMPCPQTTSKGKGV